MTTMVRFRFLGIPWCFLVLLVGCRVASAEDEITVSTIDGSSNAVIAEAVLRTAYRRLGMTLYVERYSAADALRLSSIGRTDGELHRIGAIAAQYPTLKRVDVPLLTLTGVAYAKAPNVHLDKPADLAKYRVASLKGVKYSTDLLRRVGADVVYVDTGIQLFTLLEAGRVDVVVTTRLSAPGFMAHAGVTGVRIALTPLVEIPLYHYLHESKAHLVPRIEAVLKDMAAKGEIRSICDAKERELAGWGAR